MRAGKLCLWIVTLSALDACGGRYETNPRTTGGVDATAGSSGNAGSSSGAGSSNAGTAGQPQECPCVELRPHCEPDQHLAPDLTGCCQHCEPSPSVCQQQKAAYAVQRDQVLAQFADFKCTSASDCVTTYDPSNCAMDCSFVIVTAAGRGVIDRLVILGQQICTGECVVPNPAGCAALEGVSCVQGQCRTGPER